MAKRFSPAPGLTSKIFISYRREDTGGYVHSLRQQLGNQFGAENVFQDISSTSPGEKFRSLIEQELSSSNILLAVIGPQWSSITNEKNKRRLSDPNDLVRQEIKIALNNPLIRVIPVLVHGASMPSKRELPRELANLLERQAVEIREDKWDADVRDLINKIKTSLREQVEKIPQKPISIFKLEKEREMTVLALGAHADDIEIGCAATLLYLKQQQRARIIYRVFCEYILVKGDRVHRKKEMEASAEMLEAEFDCYSYRDRELPNSWEKIQADIKNLREEYKPDLILVPSLQDTHQDHMVVAQGATREFRHGQALWHYEIKQYGQDHFDPNIFVNVSTEVENPSSEFIEFCKRRGDADCKDLAHLKVQIIQKCMKSQAKRPEFNPELLLGIMRFRGMQSSPYVKYAEAFEGRVLGFN